MSNLEFWHAVAAVIVGNALCLTSAWMVWRVARAEKGKSPQPSLWVYPFGLLSPLLVIFTSMTLP